MLFKTKRLSVRKLKDTDTDDFFDMMGNPKVMNPVPRPAMTRPESDAKLKLLMQQGVDSNTQIRAITEAGKDEFMGICGFLVNSENQHEIAYRLREKFWGIGFGTEIAKGLLNHGFNTLGYDEIIGDVFIENIPSVKILEKFMKPVKEFYNESDKCIDRRYLVSKSDFR